MKRKIGNIAGAWILAAVLVFTGTAPVAGASSDDIREEINALQREEAALQAQMDALEDKLSANMEQIEAVVLQKQTVDQQLFLLQESIANTNEQIAAYALLIAAKQEQLDKARLRLEGLNEKYKTRIRAVEEEGDMTYWSILFRANSFSDLLDRLDMIQEIAAADSRRLQEISDAAEEVASAQVALENEKTLLEATRQSLQKDQLTLDEKRAQADALLQELVSRGQEFEKLLDESEREQQELMQQIAQKEDEFDKAAYQEWLASQPPQSTQKPDTSPDGETVWLTPVTDYRLSSPFGMRLHPILGIYRMHEGIDMACPMGTPIYAARGGKVAIATESDSAGFYVQINHGDGYRSVYMHMTHFVVQAGDYVAAGQVIGYVGNSGLSKGAHLHFGISYNGTYVNPMEFLK
ncbi:MAG: peptidoglycan DD-metalloendopeptidase family protein [Oscillospiraceae bacterium]|nr:peptidoglycan DD-metalloendopeptidase family protein [Oscillospiraceae bacterium]